MLRAALILYFYLSFDRGDLDRLAITASCCLCLLGIDQTIAFKHALNNGGHPMNSSNLGVRLTLTIFPVQLPPGRTLTTVRKAVLWRCLFVCVTLQNVDDDLLLLLSWGGIRSIASLNISRIQVGIIYYVQPPTW